MSHKTSAVRDVKMEPFIQLSLSNQRLLEICSRFLMSLSFPFCLFGKVTVLKSFKGKRQRILKIFSFLSC